MMKAKERYFNKMGAWSTAFEVLDEDENHRKLPSGSTEEERQHVNITGRWSAAFEVLEEDDYNVI